MASKGAPLVRPEQPRDQESGHPSDYPRFGFVRAGLHGIRPPFAARAEAFMVLELSPGTLTSVEGAVAYPPQFAVP
jgi:predicted N-acetyltransferase YhbS